MLATPGRSWRAGAPGGAARRTVHVRDVGLDAAEVVHAGARGLVRTARAAVTHIGNTGAKLWHPRKKSCGSVPGVGTRGLSAESALRALALGSAARARRQGGRARRGGAGEDSIKDSAPS